MIVLTSTSDVVRVVLNAAHTTNALQCVASYRDITTTAYTPGRVLQSTNGTTPVSAVSSPAASTQRVVDYLSIYNADTITHTVTVSYYDGTNTYTLWKGTLATTERLEYLDGVGFLVYSSAGLQRVSPLVGTTNRGVEATTQYVWLSSEYTHTGGTTPSDVTGLAIDVTAGRNYWVRMFLNVRTLATTTGVRAGLYTSGVNFVTTGYAASHARTPASSGTTENIHYSSNGAIPTVGTASVLAQRYGGNLLYAEMLLTPENTVSSGIRARIAAEIAENVYVEPGSVLVYSEVTP